MKIDKNFMLAFAIGYFMIGDLLIGLKFGYEILGNIAFPLALLKAVQDLLIIIVVTIGYSWLQDHFQKKREELSYL